MTDEKTQNDRKPRSILEGFITEEEYARQRGVSLRTCQRDRALRQAPPHVVIGRRVFYRIDSVRAWLARRERDFERTSRRRPRL